MEIPNPPNPPDAVEAAAHGARPGPPSDTDANLPAQFLGKPLEESNGDLEQNPPPTNPQPMPPPQDHAMKPVSPPIAEPAAAAEPPSRSPLISPSKTPPPPHSVADPTAGASISQMLSSPVLPVVSTPPPPAETISTLLNERPIPADDQQLGDPSRPLNVSDALGYLDAVKNKFQNNPDVYNNFLEIMKDFKSQRIDTPGVIERVSTLFTGHPALIQGFNTFLPPGYRIECSMDPKDVNLIRVTTPQGTMTQSTTGGLSLPVAAPPSGALGVSNVVTTPLSFHEMLPAAPLATPAVFPASAILPNPFPPSTSRAVVPMVINGASHPVNVGFPSPRDPASDFQPTEQAIEYVNRIKKRYADDPASYQHFLELLEKFNKSPEDSQVLQQIVQLFRNAPDLLDEFKLFLPSDGTTQANLLGMFGQIAGDAGVGHEKESHREKLSEKASSSRRKEKGDTLSSEKSGHSPQKRKRKPVDKEVSGSKAPGPSKAKKPKHHHHPPPESSTPPPPPQMHRRAPSPVFAPPYAHVPAHAGPSHVPPPIPPATQAVDDATFFERVKQFLGSRETYDEFLKLLNLFTQDVVDLRTLVIQTSSFLGDGELMAQFKEIVGWEEQERRDMEGVLANGLPKVLQRPSKADLTIRYGPSYRKLPASEVHVPCSGRDAMCNSVLNDEWISHPSWISEDSGFIAHKKNVYEEALHKSEEERHEYDFYIEAMAKTIAVLEPIHSKIMQLSDTERSTFKLKPNWNGQLKSIHQRLLKKVYGREAGLEVVQALQDSPVLAIPVVIQRLKQKEEEWKRAQREWNKVWREVDARNYWKSLDHQAVTFKANDKKAITTKAFVSHIELAREEQLAKRASLIDPSFARTRPRYQLAYSIDDVSVLQDALKLVLSFLDRTQGQIGAHDRKKIENFLRHFIPLFFMFYQREFDSAFVLNSDSADSDIIMSDGIGSILGDDDSGSVAGSTRSKNGKKSGGGADIRKKLLKATQQQERSGSRRTRSVASTPGSRAPTPSPPSGTNGTDIDTVGFSHAPNGHPMANGTKKAATKSVNPVSKAYKPLSGSARKYNSQRGTFFANSTLYALLRLLHLLYSRLLMCKQLGGELAVDNVSSQPLPALKPGVQIMPDGTSMPDNAMGAAEHFYGHLLESCEKLFDNAIDQATFEDTVRFMFGMKAYNVFTLDKVIAALIKQVQIVLSDSKNKELVQLLQRERENPSSSTQDQINYRRKAESVVGADEHLYRINYLRDSRTFTIQLLGKDDVRDDDSPAVIERWNHYMESYQKDTPIDSLPAKGKRPFLRRNLRPDKVTPPTSAVMSYSGLETKICMRTYRLFFVSHTEDIFCWRYSKGDLHKWNKGTGSRVRKRQIWMARLDLKGWEPRVH